VPRSIAGTAGTNSYRRTDRAHAAVRPNSTGASRAASARQDQARQDQARQDQHGQSQACQGKSCCVSTARINTARAKHARSSTPRSGARVEHARVCCFCRERGNRRTLAYEFRTGRYYWNIRNLFGSKSGDAPVGHLRRCREHPLSIPPCPGGKTDVVSAPVVSVPSGAAQGQDRSMITLSGTFKACGSCDQTRG
jgi:hypothetical protein